METPNTSKREIHVKSDKKVETVEKYFRQLEFGHQIRIATETFIREAGRRGNDTQLITEISLGGKVYKFKITTELIPREEK